MAGIGMRTMAEHKRDPELEWLDHVRPTGIVVAPVVLKSSA
jgi:hypothetical protein